MAENELCPVCGREMTAPAGRALEVSRAGTREIETCCVCQALGGMDSQLAAALEGGLRGMMDRVCMFCGKVYGQTAGPIGADETSGVCPECEPDGLELLEKEPGGVSVPLSARGREAAMRKDDQSTR